LMISSVRRRAERVVVLLPPVVLTATIRVFIYKRYEKCHLRFRDSVKEAQGAHSAEPIAKRREGAALREEHQETV
jgi:hypothetical protein